MLPHPSFLYVVVIREWIVESGSKDLKGESWVNRLLCPSGGRRNWPTALADRASISRRSKEASLLQAVSRRQPVEFV